MNLGDRIKIVLKEDHLKQGELAKEFGVTESYISVLLNGRNTSISQTLATLIEEKYDYNNSWIPTGAEPKLKVPRKNRTLSDVHKGTALKIERLQPEQVKTVLAFLNFLDNDEENEQQY